MGKMRKLLSVLRRIQYRLKMGTWLNTFFLLLLSTIICSLAYEYVNVFSEIFMPTKTIELKINDSGRELNEIWICGDDSTNNLFQSCVESGDSPYWEFRDAEKYGYATDVFISSGNNVGASIVLEVPVRSNSYIMFWRNANCGTVTITVDGKEYFVDGSSELEGGEMYRFYPFQDSFLPVLSKIIIYLILIILVFCLMVAMRWYIFQHKERLAHNKFCFRTGYILLIWGFLYVYAVLQYKSGIPNYLAFGDQLYYWNIDIIKKDLYNFISMEWAEYVAQQSLSFRGYLCNVIPSISKTLGNLTQSDAIYFYLLAPSAVIAWLTGYIFPQFYKFCAKTESNIFQVLISLVLILYFWNGTLTAIVVDIFGAVAFLNGVLFVFKYLRKTSWKYALIVGLSFSAACNFRTAYQYGIYVLILAVGCQKLYSICQNHKENKRVVRDSKIYIEIIALVLGFFIIAVPQGMVNYAKGHFGFLPYDCDGAWAIETYPADSTLLESSANQSLSLGYTGWPITVADDQMLAIKNEYYAEDFLQVPQILDVYASNPIQTLQYLLKKVFLAFDIKTNMTYPDTVPWNKPSGMLFSLLNYFVLISAIYIFFNNKNIHDEEKILGWVSALGLVLPQMFVHVEWRYFLSSYLFLYYLFSYYFVKGIFPCFEDKKNNTYLTIVSMGILLSFTLSFLIYY